ncbi:MAG: hypothetical protein U1C97_02550, partial [Candidatus Gracilibacteria bacterium]|nr:hypothetical protein [Candidatus Gracilibacteria bacterium]
MNILLVSLGITFLLIVCFSRLFRTVGWLDKPQLFGYQRSPVPYGIGIVFFLVFLLLVFSFLSITL